MSVNTVIVEGSDGREWRVRVRWLPRHRSLVRRFSGWRRRHDGDVPFDPFDVLPEAALDDLLVGIAVVVGFVLAVGLVWWVVLPLLLLVLDGLVIAVLALTGIAARVLFRRPWSVEATAAGEEPIVRAVVGWRAALQARNDLASAVRQGNATVSRQG